MEIGNYKVTEGGLVYNTITGKEIRSQITNSGYVLVHLYNNGIRKAYTVHRLVAISFIPNPMDLPQVNHKDGNKLNNHVSNLEWVSPGDNMRHSFSIGNSEKTREAARLRMAILGRKYAGCHNANLLKKNQEVSIPVLQYSMDGKFIKEHASIKAARKETGAFYIKKVAAGVYKQSGGFKWALK